MTTTGVLGGQWRASVTPWGAVDPWDGSGILDWYIAADDRWHVPRDEAAARQSLVDGAPVVETRVRIPGGDAVQRVYSVADHGGLTVIEIENDSSLPVAIAFNRGDLRSVRPPASAPPQGIDLPAGSVVFPLGHRATLAVALSHQGGTGPLPSALPPALQVARGWVATSDRASRFVLPEPSLVHSLVSARCAVSLEGPAHPDDDPIDFLIGVGQLVRMGEPAARWIPDVAHAVEQAAKRATGPSWLLDAAFEAAAVVLTEAGEARARRDLAGLTSRLAVGDAALPGAPPADITLAAWLERTVVDARGRLLPAGFPAGWLGANIEAYRVPIGPDSRLSLAVRWHGDRPAVLWEVEGAPVELSAPVVAPQWRVQAVQGEALWPPPPGVSFG